MQPYIKILHEQAWVKKRVQKKKYLIRQSSERKLRP